MINKLKVLTCLVGAVGIMAILIHFKGSSLYIPLSTTLIFLQTTPILCNKTEYIAKDKFSIICYIYSIVSFIFTKSIIALLLLNIFQSTIKESKVNII